ncbi:hypothetical protein CYMTET_16768 [Cymbomonas tetramitiformis]|uniref:HECT domain-containing protein n=1 Tax=Cymbomonas tetramitiformis TaxID=36881 RepID=A0AAE0GBJ7_9CHLO|nr:hypothetical protein CYMTET_16768 [Cymbomonas tetramitiformis]
MRVCESLRVGAERLLLEGITTCHTPLKPHGKVWTGEPYVFDSIPTCLAGATLCRGPREDVAAGTVITIKSLVMQDIYLAVEKHPAPNSRQRDGGFSAALPALGWAQIREELTWKGEGDNRGEREGAMLVFHTQAKQLALPATTTEQTTMVLMCRTASEDYDVLCVEPDVDLHQGCDGGAKGDATEGGDEAWAVQIAPSAAELPAAAPGDRLGVGLALNNQCKSTGELVFTKNGRRIFTARRRKGWPERPLFAAVGAGGGSVHMRARHCRAHFSASGVAVMEAEEAPTWMRRRHLCMEAVDALHSGKEFPEEILAHPETPFTEWWGPTPKNKGPGRRPASSAGSWPAAALSGWSLEADAALGKAVQEAMGGHSAVSSTAELLQMVRETHPSVIVRPASPQLAGFDMEALSHRLKLLWRLSALLMEAAPMALCPGLRGCGAVAERLCRAMRQMMFPAWRMRLAQDIVSRRQSALRADRRYNAESHGGRRRVKVDRRAHLSGTVPPGEASVFAQLWRQMKGAPMRNIAMVTQARGGQWWTVEFAGEAMQDAGGGFRETISVIAQELMSPATPLFVPVPNLENGVGRYRETYIPNSQSLEADDTYKFLGQLMGGAFSTSNKLMLRLNPLVWKLLGEDLVTWEDYAEVDHTQHRLLEYYADALEQGWMELGEFVQDTVPDLLQANFPQEARLTMKDLDECHTAADCIALLQEAHLHRSARQVCAMREGLLDIVPMECLRLLTWKELELAVCGDVEIPVAEIRSSCVVEGVGDVVMGWLWRALEEFSAEERSLFLRFVTGQGRLPVEIKVASNGENSDRLPMAATCYNTLKLPSYNNYENLRDKLRMAIQHPEMELA